jgi:uncharacterized DUF497 family protein
MPYIEFIWNDELGGNVEHIAEHGISMENVEDVLFNPVDRDVSRSSGYPMVFGYTSDGRYIAVVYERVDETTVYPITAFEVGD